MDMKLGDGLKKFILMGIGAAAMTYEKSQQVVDELVRKGELTVEQGKELNQELKRNVQKSFEAAGEKAEEPQGELTWEEKIASMSAEEFEKLKEYIEKAENEAKAEDEPKAE